MHPFLVQRRWLALYLLLFLQAGLALAEILAGSESELRFRLWLLILPLLLVHAFSCLASWYLCRALPLGKTPLWRILLTQAGSALLAGAGLLALGSAWARFLGEDAVTLYGEAGVLVLVFAVLLYSLMVVLHYLFSALEDSRRAEARALESRVLAREAELQALRTQLDPHFLFNSLSSVSALVTTDPKLAREMCGRLAQFFRRTLDLGSQQQISLPAEIELVRDYLAIERVRFGERLEHEVDVDPNTEECSLPPLLLQPLVENAVRHGIGHLLEGGTVRVTVRRDREDLVLHVSNRCDPDRPPSRGAGVGLKNVRLRLRTLYGPAARVVTEEKAGRFEVTVRLPGPREKTKSPEETPPEETEETP